MVTVEREKREVYSIGCKSCKRLHFIVNRKRRGQVDEAWLAHRDLARILKISQDNANFLVAKARYDRLCPNCKEHLNELVRASEMTGVTGMD